MERALLIILLILAAIFAVFGLVGIIIQPSPSMHIMMGGMMLWPSLIYLSGIIFVATIVAYLLFPTIKTTNVIEEELSEPLEAILKILNPDEQKVLEVLKSSGGRCLQKDVAKKSGLSRLKVHRIVARLAERNIIVVRPYGRTNEIELSGWLASKEQKRNEVR